MECKNCKLEFNPKNKRQVFCSKDCSIFYTYKGEGSEAYKKSRREYKAKRTRKDRFWRKNSPTAALTYAWYEEAKSHPCVDCGLNYAMECMEFDHKDPATKAYNVASMVSHNYNLELIKLEVAKCDLVCTCCHRIRTWKDKAADYGASAIQDFECLVCNEAFQNKNKSTCFCGRKCMEKYVRLQKKDPDAEIVQQYKDRKAAAKSFKKKSYSKTAKEFRKKLNELKDIPCFDCGKSWPAYCMDFDHIKGVKKFDVANMVVYTDLVDEEVAKCQIVCSNCHKIRTQQRLAKKELGEYVPRNS